MSETEKGRHTPAPEHEWLQRRVGTWDVECEYIMEPGADPIRVHGSDEVEAVGPFWTVGHFSVELPGFPLIGRATLGFDPDREKFVSTWFDSATPFLFIFEGRYEKEHDALRMEGLNTDPTTGRLSMYRSKESFGNADERTLELFVETTDGPEIPLLRYEYTRRE